jgi:hypothetical protein
MLRRCCDACEAAVHDLGPQLQHTSFAASAAATAVAAQQARGCPLRSVLSVPSPASQEERLLASGWAAAAAADMAAVYHGRSSSGSAAAGCGGWLRPAWVSERARIERLELLDELEEWRLMQVRWWAAMQGNLLWHQLWVLWNGAEVLRLV